MEQKVNVRYEIANLAERFRRYVDVLDEMLETFSIVNVHSEDALKLKVVENIKRKSKKKRIQKVPVFTPDIVKKRGYKSNGKHWTQTPAGKIKAKKNLKRALAAKRRMFREKLLGEAARLKR